MYTNLILKLTARAMKKHNIICSGEVLSMQQLYTAELIINSSLLSQHVLVYWPSTGYFAFILSTTMRFTMTKV
jgi:hypothetical protein